MRGERRMTMRGLNSLKPKQSNPVFKISYLPPLFLQEITVESVIITKIVHKIAIALFIQISFL